MDQFFSRIWIVAIAGIFIVAGIFCWQYFVAQENAEIFNDEATEIDKTNKQTEEQTKEQEEK